MVTDLAISKGTERRYSGVESGPYFKRAGISECVHDQRDPQGAGERRRASYREWLDEYTCGMLNGVRLPPPTYIEDLIAALRSQPREERVVVKFDMTRIGPRVGNCLGACLATIVGDGALVELELPEFDWEPVMRVALRRVGWTAVSLPDTAAAPSGYHVGVGMSPRRNEAHGVVCLDGRIVHDPHPSRAGLAGRVSYYIAVMPLVRVVGGKP